MTLSIVQNRTRNVPSYKSSDAPRDLGFRSTKRKQRDEKRKKIGERRGDGGERGEGQTLRLLLPSARRLPLRRFARRRRGHTRFDPMCVSREGTRCRVLVLQRPLFAASAVEFFFLPTEDSLLTTEGTAPNRSIDIRVSVSAVRFQPDLDFPQFQRLARSVALNEDTVSKPISRPISNINGRSRCALVSALGAAGPRMLLLFSLICLFSRG